MKQRTKQIIHLLYLATISAFLLMPLIWHTAIPEHKKEALSENRNLAKLPKVQATALSEFPTLLDKYLKDNFPFREVIIRKTSLVRSLWLKLPSTHVIVGQGSWLFYKGDNIFKDLMGKERFSENELKTWIQKYENKQNWLNEHGIGYMLVAIPNKSTIHKNKLPWWLRANLGETRLQQISKACSTNGKLNFLNLTANIKNLDNAGIQTYWSNDTHWSGNSLAVGLEQIFEQSSKFIHKINPNIDAYTEIITRTESGDLTTLIGLKKEWPLADRQRLSVLPPKDMHMGNSPISNLDSFKAIPRSHHTFPVVINRENGKGTALIFHDSFLKTATSLRKEGRYPVALPFKRTIMIWMRPTLEQIKEIVASEKPDIVIEERVERLLFEGNNK